ncbi:MAG: response regulator [Deltaproteobacteria bacterium]|nr:response regulator [Deltaproteobacteria bacterium]
MTPSSALKKLARKRRLLLVDDNYDFFKMIKLGLGEQADLDYAPDGFSALHMVKKENYDVVICDVFMPYLDGLKLIGEFNKKHLNIPFILVTGNLEDQLASDALHAGAYNILEKPFELKELMEKVELAISLHESEKVASLSEQEKAHIYNMLKMFYYDVEKIMLSIQHFQIPVSGIQKEIEKKKLTGKCIFDDLHNLRYFKPEDPEEKGNKKD